MFYPKLRQYSTSRRIIQKFPGYDRSSRPGEGALVEMENLSSESFPTLSPRKPRGVIAQFQSPHGLSGKNGLAYVEGSRLYYQGLSIDGLTLSEDDAMCPKTLVSMGAYLVVFPDKVYLNTADLTDFGSLDNERSVECTADNGIHFSLCRQDGTVYEACTLSPQSPENPASGDHWLDSSATPPVLKVFSGDSGLWAEIPTTYVRMEGANIGAGFSRFDGVTISGAGEESLNGSAVLQAVDTNYIVITGMISQSFTQNSGTVTVSRKAPDMDFVTECGNRLWGCKYGLAEGKTVNEIYACALGDAKNWNKFQGLSTDSYAASRGSHGPWTGAITHLGCPLFFKENAIEKVYPSSTGAHQIVTTNCRGVEKGSHKSLALVGETLYYKSPTDICAYDGSLPVSVSRPLGDLLGHDAVAGSLGSLYYISFTDDKGQSHLLVYDAARNLWHREDSLRVTDFCRVGSSLFCLDGENRLLCLNGTEGQPEGKVSWFAQTGPLGLDRVDEKIISRLSLRLELESGSDLDIYARYDGEGPWVHGANLRGKGLGSQVVSLLPRRCDHFALKFKGRGTCRVYSIAMILEDGSDVQWP